MDSQVPRGGLRGLWSRDVAFLLLAEMVRTDGSWSVWELVSATMGGTPGSTHSVFYTGWAQGRAYPVSPSLFLSFLMEGQS